MSEVLEHIAAGLRHITVLDSAPLYRDSFQLSALLGYAEQFQRAWDRYYPDANSRKVFGWILEGRAVNAFYGMTMITLLPLDNPPYTKEEWKELESRAQALDTGIRGDYLLDRIDTWLLDSYSLKGRCEVLPGDVVLDCGTFTGSTSKYFSQKTGPTGHVYGFEGGSMTFATYRNNVKQFANVTPIHAAVYDHSGTITFHMDSSAGGQVTTAPLNESREEPSITLDDFVSRHNIDKVDFIKMDIEGAEANALRGGAGILRRFHPRMALSAYHRPEDLFALPDLIEEMAPGVYSFVLRHFSNTLFETVMYCIPDHPSRPAVTEPDPAEEKRLLLDIVRSQEELFHNVLMYFTDTDNLADIKVVDLMRANLQDANILMKTLMDKNEHMYHENIALRRLLQKKA